jgi:hypothetical protein
MPVREARGGLALRHRATVNERDQLFCRPRFYRSGVSYPRADCLRMSDVITPWILSSRAGSKLG